MEHQEPQVNHYLKLLWKSKWIVLLTTLVALGGVLAFSWNEPPPTPIYRATATIVVEPVGAPAGLGSLPTSIVGLSSGLGLNSGNTTLNTQVQLITSRNVMERALQKLNPDGEGAISTPGLTALQVEALQGSIVVQPIVNTNFLEIRARATSPDLAERRANVVVESYIDYVKDGRTQAIQDALEDVSSQIQSPQERQDLGSQALELLPSVGEELSDIAGTVEGSAAKLGLLRTQQEGIDPVQPLLGLELTRVQETAHDLDDLAQDLEDIRRALEYGQQQTPSINQSPFNLEASRLERTAQDLNGIGQELRDINLNISGNTSREIYDNVAIQADNALLTLKEIPVELRKVRPDEANTTKRVNSIKKYLDSVIVEVRTLTFQVETAGGAGLTEQQRIRYESQVGSHTVGLGAASKDLSDIRETSGLGINDYGRLIAVEGLIGTAVNQLRTLGTELSSVGDANVVGDGLEEIRAWVGDSQLKLEALSRNFRELDEPVVDGQEPLQFPPQFTIEIDRVVLLLDTASLRLLGLRPLVTDSLVSAQLTSIGTRLASAQASAAGSSARLTGASQGTLVTLADRVGVVQDRIENGAEELWATLENLQVATHLPSSVLENEAAIRAYSEAKSIASSLEIAFRQLRGLRGGNADPLIDGELSTLIDRLVVAQGEVRVISDRLSLIVEDASNISVSDLETNQHRLETAAQILRAASTNNIDLVAVNDGVEQDIIKQTMEQIEIGTAIVVLVSQDMTRLRSIETDALRYGQLVVQEQRLSDAANETGEIATQLRQLQRGRGPQYLQLRQMQQQLELSLLQPQDTGITIVDSAVLPQASGRASFFSRLRVPLGAIGGFLLGSVAVLVRAQVDRTVRNSGQIRTQLGMANLGVVPKGRGPSKGEPPLVKAQGVSAFSEALQLVGTGLAGRIEKGVRTILITSAKAKEGKTVLAVNLAQVLSQYGRRVLLIDGNLRKPEVASLLGLPGDRGLAEALDNQRNPMDYLVDAEAFTVLPGGTPPSNPVELLSSPAMTLFLQQAQQRFDVVLIDSPPAIGFAETKALAKGVGGALLVVKGGSTSFESLKETKDELEAVGVPLVGAVLNFAPPEECTHLRHEKYGANSGDKSSSNAKKSMIKRWRIS